MSQTPRFFQKAQQFGSTPIFKGIVISDYDICSFAKMHVFSINPKLGDIWLSGNI